MSWGIRTLVAAPVVIAAPTVAVMINVPAFRRRFWRAWYDWVSSVYVDADIAFMNYGFGDDPSMQASMAALYAHTVGDVPLSGRRTLEVGCGRGGGSAFVASTFDPAEHVGVDLSPEAVRFCEQRHQHDNLRFEVGDAMALPLDDGAFDAVINVESSHCYPESRRFLAEVDRVLAPGGQLLFSDFRPADKLPVLLSKMEAAGFELTEQRDITADVVRALDATTEDRNRWIDEQVPPSAQRLMRTFAGVRGSLTYRLFTDRKLVYTRLTATKPR